MGYNYIILLLRTLTILLVQILVCNRIHLLGYVTPLLICYPLLGGHRLLSRVQLLLWGFMTGFLFDVFSNTAGMASASCTLVAMVLPFLTHLFVMHGDEDIRVLSISTIGPTRFTIYVLTFMFLFHAVFYLLDAFTLMHWQLTLKAIGIGTLLSTALCVFIDLSLSSRRR